MIDYYGNVDINVNLYVSSNRHNVSASQASAQVTIWMMLETIRLVLFIHWVIAVIYTFNFRSLLFFILFFCCSYLFLFIIKSVVSLGMLWFWSNRDCGCKWFPRTKCMLLVQLRETRYHPNSDESFGWKRNKQFAHHLQNTGITSIRIWRQGRTRFGIVDCKHCSHTSHHPHHQHYQCHHYQNHCCHHHERLSKH